MKMNYRSINEMELNSNLTKKERKVLRIKKIILDGASELFSNNPYESVAMNKIADHVALSRATLYNYFKTKEEIFFEIAFIKLKDIIEEQKVLLKSSKSGLKGVLSIHKSVAQSLLELPFYHKTILRFFHKLDALNILDDLLFNNDSPELKLKIESFEGYLKNMVEIFIVYQRMVNSEMEKGIDDGSIKSTLNRFELESLMNLIYFGLGDFISIKLFRKMGGDIVKIVLNLIENILINKIEN